ncbi:MAG: GH36-type glycosyl hydrolase domain-containing protein [Candidatus Geothermarchaeales archaeon]
MAKKINPLRPDLGREGIEEAERYLMSLLKRDFSPGGYYDGIWVRDAYFQGTFLLEAGHPERALELLEFLRERQISGFTRLIHGRGSPITRFHRKCVRGSAKTGFIGALPTSIHGGSAEVYGYYPDIDSTCLYVALAGETLGRLKSKALAHRFLGSVERCLSYVERRDVNGDGLPEQMENEDWADNLLRSGNVTYTMATYVLALKSCVEIAELAGEGWRVGEWQRGLEETLKRIDEKLWVLDHYAEAVDLYGSHIPSASQDTSLLLLTGFVEEAKASLHMDFLERELDTPMGPLNIHPPRRDCAPLRLRPHRYQNSTVWPWLTALQIEACAKHGRGGRGAETLKKIFPFIFYEWFDAKNPRRSGAYPFKTSAAAVLRTIYKLNRGSYSR